MRCVSRALMSGLVAAGLGLSLGSAPPAHAYDAAVNGKYVATIVGDWARSRQVLHQEPVVRSVWTITSSCQTAMECTGTVVSDQGWTATIHMHDGLNWFLKREIPNWETCGDGTSYPGTDYTNFYPSDPETGVITRGSPVFAGSDRTLGPSGACATSWPLDIAQPFRLDKID